MAKRKASAMSGSGGARRTRKSRKVAPPSKTLGGQKIYTFRRYVSTDNQATLTISNPNVQVGEAFAFSLSKLAGYTDITSLFDLFRITKIEVFCYLINNPDSAYYTQSNVANGTNWYPRIWLDVDHDDATITPSVNVMKERQGVVCKHLQPNRVVKFSFKPSVLTQIQSGTSIMTSPLMNQWCDNSDTYWFGLKAVVDAFGGAPIAGQPFSVKLDFRYTVQCKKVQ